MTPSTVKPMNSETLIGLPDYKAVLWDMDGTLVDSEPLHDESIRMVGEALGYPVSQEIVDEALGVGHRHCYDIIQKYLNMPVDFDTWMAKVEKTYLDSTSRIIPRTNTVEVVKALHARGIKQAIFSNSPRKIVEANAQGFLRFFDNPDQIFSAVLSIDDVKERKPHPEGYLLAAQKLGVKPEECLVIEDSPTGSRAGLAAGMFTIFWPEHAATPIDVEPHMNVRDLSILLS